jgi:hypothetical protein
VVSIKVGVLTPEKRDSGTFWLEFDPTVPGNLTENSLLLPYIVLPTSSPTPAPFFVHNIGGCSSALRMRGKFTNQTEYRMAANERCLTFTETHPNADWFLWDQLRERQFEMFLGITAAYQCQLPTIRKQLHFPSISLTTLFKETLAYVPEIDTLDIDAQGADLAILLSLGDSVKRAKRVKIECQTEGLELYEAADGIENHCNAAAAYMRGMGFDSRLQINNCGCMEYNLYFTKQS